MAKMTTDKLLGAFEEMTVLELSEFLKAFEEKFEVTAAAERTRVELREYMLPIIDERRTGDGEDSDAGDVPFALRQAASAIENIEQLSHDLDIARLRLVADRLIASRKVFLAGSLSSAGFVQYLGYLASLAFENWRVVDNGTASLPMVVTDLSQDDAVVVILKDPYAARSVNAARFAAEAGAFVVVISNQVSCPAFQYATQRFIVPSDSPQFFSSYAATLVLIECLAGMLIRRSGPDAQARLAEVESNGHRLGEYWPVT